MLFGALGKVDWSYNSFKSALFPILSDTWWFASTYFVLYLLHPFINIVLNKLNKRQCGILLLLLVVMWSVIPTVSLRSFQGNSLLWFMTMYVAGAFARLHGFNPKLKTLHYLLLFVLFTALTYLTSLSRAVNGGVETRYYGQEKLTVFLMSVNLFMTFATLKMKPRKWINVVGPAMFGVYLIHDHPQVRSFLWRTLFKNASFADTALLIPYSIMAVAAVLAVCTVIDLVRIYAVEKPVFLLVDRCLDAVVVPFSNVCGYLMNFLFGKDKAENPPKTAENSPASLPDAAANNAADAATDDGAQADNDVLGGEKPQNGDVSVGAKTQNDDVSGSGREAADKEKK